MSNLNDTLIKVKDNMEAYFEKNGYDTLHFTTGVLSISKSIKFTMILQDKNSGAVMFHNVVSADILTAMEEKDVIEMILDSFKPIIANIAKLDSTLEKEESKKFVM